ncbi:MAG: Ig-like domain-containing protein [Mogibacterium sp.]|nr:Ig-like domain-containing protein [Mogibacterium sp.]
MNNGDRKLNAQTRKLLKRMLALLIAVVLVAGLGLSYSADRVLRATSIPEEEAVEGGAEPAPEEAPVTTQEITLDSGKQEPAKEEPAPQPEPEPEPEPQPQPEPENVASAEPQAGSDTSTEKPEGGKAQEATAEAGAAETEAQPEAVVTEEVQPELLPEQEAEQEEEEIKYPAQKLTAKASDGAMVTVDAPEGALPEGSRVTIKRVSSKAAKAAIESTLGDDTELVDVVVYDIVIYDHEGKEVQPDSSVKVSIIGAGLEAGEEASLYHVDGNSADKVSDVADPGQVSFNASHFSEYAIATTSSAGGDDADTGINTVMVGSSITLTAPNGYKSYTWSVSPKNYVTVSGNGRTATVTGVKAGTVTVSCKMSSGGWFSSSTTEEYTVKVTEQPRTPEISISPKTATLNTIGATQTFRAELSMIDADNSVVWTSSDPSIATVENGVVTAKDEGTVTITASVSPEEDELYGNTYSDSATVNVAFSSYNVYHYALIPGASADTVGAAGADASWFGLGVTKVSGVPNPTSIANGAHNFTYKIGAAVNGKTLFPDLTYGGTTYKYAAPGSAEAEQGGYYTVTPFRLVVANGANAGNNKYNSTVGSGKTYHLDYMAVLNEKSYVSASFVLRDADSTSYEALMDYGQRFRAGTSQSQINKPSASVVPATKKYDGITYSFDGWYLDEGCTQKADFAGTIESNMTFYGRYIPTNARYRVEYYYDGVIDASLTEVKGPVALGTVVSTFDPKAKNGFNLSDVEPSSITVSENEADNIIRVYYTKRLVTYRVGYYIAGTNESIAPAVSKTCKFGETGTGTRLDIAGYTPADADNTKSMVIEASGSEIRFYYYKNVTLTANSAEFAYNGEPHSVSGYTCDQPDADFGDIAAGAEGTAAGIYEAAFTADLTGRVDNTGRYIVTGTRAGSLVIRPAEVTVTANASGKAYGQDDPELTASVSGLAAADEGAIEYTVTRDPGEEVGEYAIHAAGEAEQGNYHVTYQDSAFTISKSDELNLIVNGFEGVYDGQSHAVSAVPSVADGTTVEYSTDGGTTWSPEPPAITNVGEAAVSVRAVNPGYEDAAAETVLRITPRPVTITAVSTGKTFGEPDPELTADVTGTIGEDTVSYTVQRAAGESAGTYEIMAEAAADQGNYTVTTVPGEFTINKAVMETSPMNIVKVYDGQPVSGQIDQAVPAGTVVSYSVDGENWTDVPPSRTDAGMVMYTIRLENPDYETAFIPSVISIAKRNVILRSGSDSKEYDGNALTNSDVSVTGDGFAEGEGAEFNVTGTQTVVGTSANTFEYTLNEGTSELNYDISTEFGKLEVTSRDAQFEINLKVNGGDYLYDGKMKIVSGFESQYFTLNGNKYYVDGMEAYLEATDAGEYTVIATGEPHVYDAAENEVTDQFKVGSIDGKLTIRKRQITLTSASANRPYNGSPLINETVTVSGDDFAPEEGAFFSVTGKQTAVGSSENTFAYFLNEGTKAANYEITTVPGSLTVTSRPDDAKYEITVRAAGGEFTYDGTEHEVSGVMNSGGEAADEDGVLTFKVDGHDYSVSGLTAKATGVNAGTYRVNVTGSPVVRDEEGNDVTSEFVINTLSGDLVIAKRSVTLASASDSHRYNGKPLMNDKVTVGGDGFVRGEGAEYIVTGSQTLAGSSPNRFTYVLSDGTLAENYDIQTEFGTLTITNRDVKYEIEAVAKSGSFVYDGTEKSVSGLEAYEFEVEGSKYTLSNVNAEVTGTAAGNYTSLITGTPVVTDADGNDVTDQFAVSLVPGKLEITRRAVILTSADAEKQYDGKPLTNSEVTISGDGFVEGENVVIEVTGSRTLPGTSENTFNYYAAGGTDLNNYDVSNVPGRLLVRARDAKYEITMRAPGQRVLYDGKAHEYEGFETTEFEIEGNKFTVSGITASCSGTDAGTYTAEVSGTAVVTDSDGNDVTGQFIVNTEAGDIVILPREVVLTSGTASKEYDGQALTNDEVTVSGEGFAEGEGAAFTVTGTQKTVGSSENVFTYELKRNTSAENYSITTVPGTLTVTNRDAKYSITVTANSGSFKYDGAEKTVEGLIEDTFTVDGNVYTVSGLTAAGTGTHAGTYPVNITGTAVVTDADGNDVTDQFAVTPVNGTLEITKRNVILTSASAEKVYDGAALVNNEVTVGGDGFAEGEGATYNVSGKRTIVGFIANLFSYILNDGTEAGDYNISVIPGQLNIFGRPEAEKYEVSVAANSGTFVYDGEDHTVSGLAGEEEGKLTVAAGGNTYTISGLTASATLRDAGSASVVVEGKPVVTDSEGNDVTSEFRIKPVNGTIEVQKRNVILTSASESKEYDGEALTNDEVTVSGDGFVEGEGASYEVTGLQKLVGSSENSFTYKLDAGTKADNYSVSVVPGTLTVTNRDAKYEITVEAKSGSYKYSGAEKSVEGFKEETFEIEGNTYTVSGLTASAAATDAGTYPVNVTGTAVVTDAAGNDVTDQFAVTPVNGTLEITKRYVELTSASANKQYDGKSLTAQEVTVSRDGFAEGEGAEFTVTGSQTLVGSSDNSFSYSLTAVTKADNYIIKTVPGRLTVSDREAKYEITLKPKSDAVVYDGQKHVVEGFESTEFTFDGVTYSVTGINSRAAGMNAGEHPVVIEGGAVILDADGNDVTTQFITNIAPASLTISKRSVTLTSGTSAKEYDGQALTNDEVTVTGDGFAEGEGAAFTVTGTQKTVGSSENAFTYELKRGTSADNYNITTVPGTLTVTNRDAKYSITVTANSGSFKYDGAEKTVEGLVADTFEVEGNTYTVSGLTAAGTGTHAGTYPVNITGTAVVTDADGSDVTDQFAVTPVNGTLEITKRNVILTSASAEKIYDGQPLTNAEVAVTGDGFAEGEGATYAVSGKRTIVGFIANLFSYILNDGTNEGDYNITVVPGQLNIFGRPEAEKYEVSVAANSGSFMYDGEAHEVSGLVGEEEGKLTVAVGGNTYTISGLTASASLRDAGTAAVAVEGQPSVTDADGNDVTSEFRIKPVNGTIEVQKRNVILTSASDSKQYDGEALTNNEVTVTGDGFVEGEGASYEVTGSQKLVGSSENSFTYNLNAGTKADNYSVSVVPGTLTVTNRDAKYEVSVEAKSGSYKYSGEERTAAGFKGGKVLEDGTFTVDVTADGNTYTVSGLTASATATDAGTYSVNVTGIAVVTDAAGNDVTEQFAVTPVNGTLEIGKRYVELTSANANKQYDGKSLTAQEVTVSRDGFAEGEGAEYAVTGSQTLVGSSDNTFSYSLKEGTKADNYIIKTVPGRLTVSDREAKFEITLRPKSGAATYDGQKHVVEGFEETEFTFDGVTYTVTGINARAAGTSAGEHPVVIEGGAVILDADGNDVTTQFITNIAPASLTIGKRSVTLTSGTSAKEYDGQALTNDVVTVTGDGFAEGEGAAFKVTGTQKTVGSSENTFTYELKRGTSADNYNITTVPGTLTVTNRDAKYSITVNANSGSFKYDGTEKNVEGLIEDTFTVDGNVYTVSGLTAQAAAVHAGTYPVNITGIAVVTDADGNDVTDQFAVTPVNGTLEITKRNVILTSANAEKVYDGTALRNDEITVTGDGFAEGQGAEYKVTGTRTIRGASENSFTYALTEGTLAADYDIRTIFGMLTISGRPEDAKYEVSVAAASGSFKYDGAEHAVSGLVLADGTAFADGEAVTFTAGGNEYTLSGLRAGASAVAAGEYKVAVTGTPIVRDADGNDVTEEFIISMSAGQMNIVKRDVVLTSADAVKEYDGKPLTNGEVTVSGDAFAEGEGAEFTVTGTQTVAGTSENTFVYSLTSGTSANNYNIITRFGSLNVTNRNAKYSVTMRANSGSFKYDGTAKTVEGFEGDRVLEDGSHVRDFSVEGNIYTVSGLTASGSALHAGSHSVAVTGSPVVRDADGNDVTEQFSVLTENGTLDISKRSVILSSAGGSAMYTGDPLTAADITVSGDGFAEGEGAVYTVSGSQTIPGSSENKFTYILAGGTLAEDYDISTEFGTLTILGRGDAKYEITAYAAGGSAVYDGEEHTAGGFVSPDGEVIENGKPLTYKLKGKTYTVEGLNAVAAGTNAGSYQVNVTGSPLVRDADGNDVSSEFLVHTVNSSLEIAKRSVTLTSADGSQSYNGSPLTNDKVTVGGDGFVRGEGAEFTVTGSQTVAGSSPNSFTYALNEGTLAENYDILTELGTLTVTDRDVKYEIEAEAASGSYLYDGKVKSADGIVKTTFDVEGHTYTLSGISSAVTAQDAGIYNNVITGEPIVTDEAGNDVTAQFAVSLVPGKLEITKRTVTLTSADAEKQYDGTPLTNTEVAVSGDGFAEGESAVYRVTGSQLITGRSGNEFEYVLATGTKAGNYEISKVIGTLLVRDRDAKYEITLRAPGQRAVYDGAAHEYEGFETTEFEIEGNKYTVSGVTVSCSGTDAGTYTAKIEGSAVVTDADGNDVTGQFIVNTDAGEIVILPREVVLTSGTSAKEYDGEALTNDAVTVSGDGFIEGEGASFTVTGSQKTVGSSANSFTYELNDGTKAGNYRISEVPGTLTITNRDAKYSITVNANSGSFKYDGTEKTVEGLIRDTFEVDGNTYTVSGLTAAGTGTHAGTYPVSINGTAVVTDADGNDVTDQFAVTPVSGTLEITKRNVILTSASAEKVYDGTALVSNEVTVTGDGFAEGEGATYNVSGKRTIVGFIANLFSYILNDGTEAGDYNISVVPGQLNIFGRPEAERYEVSVAANSGTFMYDGEAHEVSGLVGEEEGKITARVGGNAYTISGLTASATLRDAGKAAVTIEGKPVVTDAEGNDVTNEFRIKPVNGTIEVTRRSVVMTSASDSKQYDGEALTNDEVTVTGDGFAEGEGASYSVTGLQKLVGSSENSFTYKLDAGTKADNYSVSVVPGTLTVTNRDAKYEVTVEAKSGSYKYSGAEKSVEGFKEETFEVEGNTYTVSGLTASAAATDAGTYPVNVVGTAKVTDAAGNDVTDQFAVTPVNGTLEITRRYIELTSANANKQYDGKSLTAQEVTVSRDGFAEGEGADFTVTGSQTLVGSSDNTFSYSLREGTKAENYIIKTVPGKLTVSDRAAKYEITLRPSSDAVVYDGQKHVVEGFEETEFTFDGVTYTVTGINARAAGMNAGEHPVVIEGGAVILDADGNDVTTQFITHIAPASLTISKRAVTLTSGTSAKEYDGQALTNAEVTVSGEGFAEGEGAEFKVTGTQKTVGSSENVFTYELKRGTSADNYNITTVPGTLTVTNRDAKYSITVTANSGSFKYDGTEKAVEGLTEETFEVEGNTYTVSGLTAQAAAVHAGTYPVNIIGTAVVRDDAGNDVSDQFAVTPVNGTLEITRRTAVFTSADAEKEYDGQPLTNNEVAVTGDGFAEGEGAEFTVTGSRVLAGESENSFTYALTEGTLAADYDISVVPGKLTVNNRSKKFEISLKPVPGAALYDGAEHRTEGFEKSEFTFGGVTYTVSGLSASASGTDAGRYPVNVTGKAAVTDPDGNDVTDQFSISVMPAELVINPRTVIMTSASATGEYNGEELRSEEVTVTGDGFAEGEGAEYTFTGAQTLVGISENTFEYALTEGTKAENYVITTACGTLNVTGRETAYSVTVRANSGTFKYDGAEKAVDGFVTSTFDVDGNTYTVSGLTAHAAAVHAGKYPVNIIGTAVVRDAAGNDVSDQFRVETVPGTLEITRRAVTITSGSAEKAYDGGAITSDEISVGGDGFAEGEGAAYEFSGSRIIPGSSENAFTYTLNEGTLASDYDIRTEYGMLAITKLSEDARYEIAVSARGGSFKYDGEEHSAGGLISRSAGRKAANSETNEDSELKVVINGHTYTVTGLEASRTETNAGSYKVNVTGTPVVLDSNGNDVTDQFVIRSESAVLNIAKREITLTSGSSTHAYNGKPLTNGNVEVSGDGFAEGEGASYDVTGTRTVVGTSSNDFTYSLNDGTSADNYTISTVFGQLNVTGRDAKYLLTMTPQSGSYLYDGDEKRVSGFISTHAVIEGNRYEVSGLTASAEGTSAGKYKVKVSGTPVVTDAAGNDVSDQFAVEVEPATLEIRPRQIVLRSPDVSKEYDGTPLTGEEVTVEGDGFAGDDGVALSNHSSRTIVGVTQNSFDWTFNEGTDAGNYDVSTVFGYISITGRDRKYEVKLVANSDAVEYDGNEHTVTGFAETEFVIENNEFNVTGIESSATGTEPGVYGTVLEGDAVVSDADGHDVTEEFAVSYVSGALTITEKPQAAEEAPGAPAATGGDDEDGGDNGGGGQPADTGAAGETGAAEQAEAGTASVEDTGIPYANAPSGYWALLNLIMAVLSVVLALINGIRWLVSRKKDDED